MRPRRRPSRAIPDSGIYDCRCGAAMVSISESGGTCKDGHWSTLEEFLAANLQGARLLRLADVEPADVSWLWPGRIPFGKLTILDGDPGLGKSTLTLDLAARLTTHRPMPEESAAHLQAPYGVVLLSAEDGMSDTVRPRLDAAGADSARVHAIVSLWDPAGGERLPNLLDLEALRAAIEQLDAALVIVDPLMAYLPPSVNAHNDQEIRSALAPVARLAEETLSAFLLVRHLNKSGEGKAVYRGGGSIGIIGAARAGLLVARDPQDPQRRIVAVSKSNLAAEAPSLAYRLATDGGGHVRIEWEGESPLTADELLDDAPSSTGKAATVEAAVWLHGVLGEDERPARDVEEAAGRLGFSARTLRQAREHLRVQARREGVPGKRGGGVWLWSLPDEASAQLELLPTGDSPEPLPIKARVLMPIGENARLNPERPFQPISGGDGGER